MTLRTDRRSPLDAAGADPDTAATRRKPSELLASGTSHLRGLLVDPDAASLGSRARARRELLMAEAFPEFREMVVLDLGGTPNYWSRSRLRPQRVVTLNLEPCKSNCDWVETRQGDACAPPADLLYRSFDLVVSNSVIEHVGGHERRKEFANVVRSHAPLYWVQTPYRYFPIEPHWVCPGFQFLPTRAKVAVYRRWPLAWSRPAGTELVENVLGVELLGRTEMRHYFPEAAVLAERFVGITKSLIAARI